jgi:hypothetical protein
MSNEEKIALIQAMDAAGYEVTGMVAGSSLPVYAAIDTNSTTTITIKRKAAAT